MLTKILQLEPDELCGRRRDKHLAAVANRRDAAAQCTSSPMKPSWGDKRRPGFFPKLVLSGGHLTHYKFPDEICSRMCRRRSSRLSSCRSLHVAIVRLLPRNAG